ncbi:MAG: SHOCT domain-containing protein [Oscillospiraceae bacterium]|nr:SHOCT domain-containing protein [Oscillospiraceae bacterium]
MGLFDKAKNAAKNYTSSLKENEAKNKEMANAPMEERIKMRPEGVKYCIVNNLGKILDVYENKVVFTSTKSTSTLVTGLVFGNSVTQGEKTIYYKDATGVQYKPSTVLDGYIQVETASGNMTSSSSQYSGENSIQFSGKKLNEEAEIVVAYIKDRIEEIKNAPVGGAIQQLSPADELKKHKELLDLGIITQEEFDAKKKQLLGL